MFRVHRWRCMLAICQQVAWRWRRWRNAHSRISIVRRPEHLVWGCRSDSIRRRKRFRFGKFATVSKMALLWTVISFAFSLLLTPFLMLLLAIVFLASIGKSLGVRRLYIKLLLALFEVSCVRRFPNRICETNRHVSRIVNRAQDVIQIVVFATAKVTVSVVPSKHRYGPTS